MQDHGNGLDGQGPQGDRDDRDHGPGRKSKASEAKLNEVVRKARERDQNAITTLTEHVRDELLRFTKARMGPVARREVDAEDIVQQVLLESLQKMTTLEDRRPYDEYRRRVHQLAKWRVADAARRRKRDHGETGIAGSIDELLIFGDQTGPVTRSDDVRWLRELIARLPEPAATIVRLRAFEELPWEEIGHQIGKTNEAARKIYERIKTAWERAQRQRQKERDDDEPDSDGGAAPSGVVK